MATDIAEIKEVKNREILEEDWLYEVVDGNIVERPPMSTEQEVTAGILHLRLGHFVDATKLGRAVMETLFDFTDQINRKRRPDVAYVSGDRWPRTKPVGTRDGWLVVPNLAIEIISRTNSWDDVQDKIHEYFQVGVQRVWVITTSKKLVHVHTSPTEVKILSINDELTDEHLLPGFRLAIADLFEVVE